MSKFLWTLFLSLNVASYAAQEVAIEPVIEQEQEVALYAQPNLQKWVGEPTRGSLLSYGSVILLRNLGDAQGGRLEDTASIEAENERIFSLSANFVNTKEIKHFLTFMHEETNNPEFLEKCSNSELVALLCNAHLFNLNFTHENYQFLTIKVIEKLHDFNLKQFKIVVMALSPATLKTALKEMQLALISNWRVSSRPLKNHLGEAKTAFLKENGLWDFEISIDDLPSHSLNGTLYVRGGGPLVLDLSKLCLTSLSGISRITHSNDIKIIDLSHNDITALHQDEFEGFANAWSVDLSHNEIAEIQPGAFRGLDELTALDLAHNQIAGFCANNFVELKALIGLDVSHNQLTEVALDDFFESEELRHFNLEKNKIKTFSTSDIAKLPKLTGLKIGGNKLQDRNSFAVKAYYQKKTKEEKERETAERIRASYYGYSNMRSNCTF